LGFNGFFFPAFFFFLVAAKQGFGVGFFSYLKKKNVFEGTFNLPVCIFIRL